MRKLIFSIFVALSLTAGISSCSSVKHVQNIPTIENISGYSQMRYTMDKVLGQHQVDSMITADRLQPINKWIVSGFGNRRQYVFIRSLGENELIYTATTTQVDTLFKCTKRITKTITE